MLIQYGVFVVCIFIRLIFKEKDIFNKDIYLIKDLF